MLRHLDFPPGAIKNWSNLGDAELRFFPVPWTINILPLASVNEQSLVAKLAVDATCPPFGCVRFHRLKGQLCMWVENVLEYLAEPGEWCVDTQQRKIYYWPRGDAPEDQIVAPRMVELIRVEGEIDESAPVDKPVRGLVFCGLTLRHGARDTWDASCKGRGIQHDWEMYDRATAVVRVRGAEDCVVRECRITSSSGTAIRLDLHCQNIKIMYNLIDHVGGAAVLICGYGPGTKDVNKHNQIISNDIHHCGLINLAAPTITIWQSGANRIAHNLIHDCPRQGIAISGVRSVSFNPDTPFQESTKTIRWQGSRPASCAARSANASSPTCMRATT